MNGVASIVALVMLLGVHVFMHRIKFFEGTPRSAWLSFAGGVAVAYVFVHLLPELSASGRAIEELPEERKSRLLPFLLGVVG